MPPDEAIPISQFVHLIQDEQQATQQQPTINAPEASAQLLVARVHDLETECTRLRAAEARAAKDYAAKREAWCSEVERLERQLAERQGGALTSVSKQVLVDALRDATTALAATRENLTTSALQVASLKSELSEEKQMRRRAQGLADELADRVLLAHRSKKQNETRSKTSAASKTRSTVSSAQESIRPKPASSPSQPKTRSTASSAQESTRPKPASSPSTPRSKASSERRNDPEVAERSVRFEEFASVAEFVPGSRVFAPAGPPAPPSSSTPEPANGTAAAAGSRRRPITEPVTPARESLARPQAATVKHEAYRTIKTPKTKSRHRVRLALELGCLAGKGSAEQRAAATKALKSIEESNHRAFIVLEDDPTCRPAFRGIYIQCSGRGAKSTGKENQKEPSKAFFSRVFGMGPEVLSCHDVCSFFSWNDVEKRLVRVEGPLLPVHSPKAKPTSPTDAQQQQQQPQVKKRNSLLSGRPWQPREFVEDDKPALHVNQPQGLNLAPTIVAIGTNKISLKYLRKGHEASSGDESKRAPFFKLYEQGTTDNSS